MNNFLEKVKTKVNITTIKEGVKEYLIRLWTLSVVVLVLFDFDDFDGIPWKVSMPVALIGLSIYLLYVDIKKIKEIAKLLWDITKFIIFTYGVLAFIALPLLFIFCLFCSLAGIPL